MENIKANVKPATDKQIACIRALQLKFCRIALPVEELKKLSLAQASQTIDRLKSVMDEEKSRVDGPVLGMIFKLVTQELNIGWILSEPENFILRVRRMYYLYRDCEKSIEQKGRYPEVKVQSEVE